MKDTFYSENNQALEQPPQGFCRVNITGGFPDVIRQVVRQSHLASLFHKRLKETVFQGTFQLGQFYESMNCIELKTLKHLLFRTNKSINFI